MKLVLMARYFFWVLLFQLTTFYKLKPWVFLFGLVMWTYHFIRAECEPPHLHGAMIVNGVTSMREGWTEGYLPTPPKFVQRGFSRLTFEILQT